MKRKVKLWILCLTATLLFGSIAQPLRVNAGTSSNKYSGYDLIGQYEKELGKMNVTVKTGSLTQSQSALVTRIDAEWKAGTIFIEPTDGKEIKFIQKGYQKQDKSEQMTYTLEKGVLKIRDGRKNVKPFTAKIGTNYISLTANSTNQSWWLDEQSNEEIAKRFDDYRRKNLYDITIQMPKKQYKSFNFESESAFCSLTNMDIKDAESDCKSGIVQYKNCTLLEVSGETVNGDINLIGTAAGDVEAEAVNGDLRIDNCTVSKLELDVINGDIMVSQKLPAKECELSAVNGDICILPGQFPSGMTPDFKASVSNGDITLILPANKGFYISKKSIGSGDIHSEFKWKSNAKNYVYGDGKYRLNISCSSGDIHILKAD